MSKSRFFAPAHEKILAKMSELQVRIIDRYRRSADLTHRSDARFMQLALKGTKRKVAQGEPREIALDYIESELEIGDQILELSEQLAIVALYRVVELGYGRIVRMALGAREVPKWVGRVDTRDKKLRTDFGVAMSDLRDSDSIEELRALNNAVKHHSVVTSELARHAGWVVGKNLGLLSASYERLAPLVPGHVHDFAQRVFRAKPPNYGLQPPVGAPP